MNTIILASTSSYRRDLLSRLGVPFECMSPNVDEDPIQVSSRSPREIAECLARLKAEAVRKMRPHAIVIGGDQLVHLDGVILGKPGSREKAVEQLAMMSGKTHELITSISVVSSNGTDVHTDVARLTMRRLSLDAIRRYVDHDDPIHCAGSYMLEKQGIALVERIECEDHTAIQGLPLMALAKILNQVGVAIP